MWFAGQIDSYSLAFQKSITSKTLPTAMAVSFQDSIDKVVPEKFLFEFRFAESKLELEFDLRRRLGAGDRDFERVIFGIGL